MGHKTKKAGESRPFLSNCCVSYQQQELDQPERKLLAAERALRTVLAPEADRTRRLPAREAAVLRATPRLAVDLRVVLVRRELTRLA